MATIREPIPESIDVQFSIEDFQHVARCLNCEWVWRGPVRNRLVQMPKANFDIEIDNFKRAIYKHAAECNGVTNG